MDSTETPMGKTISHLVEMKIITRIGLDFMEPEPDYVQNSFVRPIEKPSYWSQLGSSKNRSNAQQEEGKAIKQDILNEVSASSVLACFTDRSCLPNPGPCGAWAVIYHPDRQEECIKRPLTAYVFFLLGVLVTILSVKEHFVTNNSQIQHREIRRFSDCQTAVGRIIALNWVSNHYLDVIKINENISSLESKGWNF